MARGGARPGAGRPKVAPEDKKQRPQHQLRAWEDEWEKIKIFARVVKHDPDLADKLLKMVESQG